MTGVEIVRISLLMFNAEEVMPKFWKSAASEAAAPKGDKTKRIKVE